MIADLSVNSPRNSLPDSPLSSDDDDGDNNGRKYNADGQPSSNKTTPLGSSRRFEQFPFLDSSSLKYRSRPVSLYAGHDQAYHDVQAQRASPQNKDIQARSEFLEKAKSEEEEARRQIQRFSLQQRASSNQWSAVDRNLDSEVEQALEQLLRLKEERDKKIEQADSEARRQIEKLRQDEEQEAKRREGERRKKEEEAKAKQEAEEQAKQTAATEASAELDTTLQFDADDVVPITPAVSAEAKEWAEKYCKVYQRILDEVEPKISGAPEIKRLCFQKKMDVNRRLSQLNGEKFRTDTAIREIGQILQDTRNKDE
ncbi:hypothetical protein EV182_004664, partial [Spiromyces aspiralis]